MQDKDKDIEKNNELTTETEPEQQSAGSSAEEMTEEEKQEILSVFSETHRLDQQKKQKKGFKLTIKNQLIIIGCVLAVAAVLLICYFSFLKPEEELDPFYVLSEKTEQILETLDSKVTIRFDGYPESEYSAELSPERYRTYTYATLYDRASRNVSVRMGNTSVQAKVAVGCGEKWIEIPFEDFYAKRKVDGQVYGFAGERLLTNAILTVTGKSAEDAAGIAVRPLDGFDEDGDTVLVSGGVVMFPMVNRDDIDLLNISNAHGTYSIYREKDTFYFKDCELLEYDEEKFASLVVDCRYMVTAGKMTEQLGYDVYGLDSEEHGTATYTLITKEDADGNRLFHTVRIGKKAASGSYYYGLYYGGRLNRENEVIESFTNPKIYMIPYSNVEGNLLLRKEDYFTANLVYGVSSAEDCYKVDFIHMDYYDREDDPLSILVRNLSTVLFSDNIASNNGDAVNVLKDKVYYSGSGKTYSDWLGDEDKGYFVGLTTSDGNDFTLTAVVTNTATDGKYECRFGLLKDLDNGQYPALLPDSVSIRYSADGVLFKKLSGVTFDFGSQKENTVRQYSFTVESEQPVLLIELSFKMPKTIGYLVMDELDVFANGEDAVPNDALSGVWRLTQPSSMVPAGKTFSYLDSSNFSNFIYGLCMLKGDGVERVGISTRDPSGKKDDVIDAEVLKEYGLDQPSMHFSYLFNGYTTDLYISALDPEKQCYYAYSTIRGDVYGTGSPVTFCTGMVGRISLETADWLKWDPLEYIDHQLFDIYVYDITEMKLNYEGKDYTFEVSSEDKTLTSVRLGSRELNEKDFRYLYLSIVQLNLKNAYTLSPDEEPEEYMRISVRSKTDYREYVFYRVSSSKAFYTINGEGSYYCLVSSLRNVMKKADLFVAGEEVTR